MREILFRGKRVNNGEWVEGFLLIGWDEIYAIMEKDECDWGLDGCYCDGGVKRVIPETIGQYTGLTDKNGTKIFEGDIMPVYEQGEEYYYKVVYNGDCFVLAMLDSVQGSYPLSTKNTISEVIGNIHDNPELIRNRYD